MDDAQTRAAMLPSGRCESGGSQLPAWACETRMRITTSTVDYRKPLASRGFACGIAGSALKRYCRTECSGPKRGGVCADVAATLVTASVQSEASFMRDCPSTIDVARMHC